MTRLIWGEGPRLYDQGLDQGVLYLESAAVPWNGLVSVAERDSAIVNADLYFDGNKLAVKQDTGEFGATIAAYTYPDVFAEYNGYSPKQTYRRFGLSYRTDHGDGYKIHIVYNILVDDGSRIWKTIGDRVDPSLFSWDIYASSLSIPGASPASHLVIEVPRDGAVFDAVEDILYGTDLTDPRLPDPAELIELYEEATLLRITYNGDGTYTASGPDDMVQLLGDGRFSLTAPTVIPIDQDIFVVNSY